MALHIVLQQAPRTQASLAAAILLLVATHLSVRDLSSLTRTAKEIHTVIQLVLYDRALTTTRPGNSTAFQLGPTPNRSILHFFAAHGRLPLLRKLLSRLGQASDLVNTPDDYGHTPLLSAVLWGDIATVQALLLAGADIECTTKRMGWTPLHCAVLYGNLQMAQVLVTQGADTRCKDRAGGFTPLHLASRCVSLSGIFAFFRNIGWDCTAPDDFGLNPFQSQEIDIISTPKTPEMMRRAAVCRQVRDERLYMMMYEADRCRWCTTSRVGVLTPTSFRIGQRALSLLETGKTETDLRKVTIYQEGFLLRSAAQLPMKI